MSLTRGLVDLDHPANADIRDLAVAARISFNALSDTDVDANLSPEFEEYLLLFEEARMQTPEPTRSPLSSVADSPASRYNDTGSVSPRSLADSDSSHWRRLFREPSVAAESNLGDLPDPEPQPNSEIEQTSSASNPSDPISNVPYHDATPPPVESTTPNPAVSLHQQASRPVEPNGAPGQTNKRRADDDSDYESDNSNSRPRAIQRTR